MFSNQLTHMLSSSFLLLVPTKTNHSIDQLMFAPTMPQSAPHPVFASANQNNDGDQEWQMDGSGGDPMDFDLLAEYLLDDNVGSTAGLSSPSSCE
jgi:hypothetical protein